MNQISKNFYNPPLSTKELNTNHMVDFKNKGVSIYGTGNYGIIVFTALKKIGVNVNYFIDNNTRNWGTKFLNIKVLSHLLVSTSQ